MSPARQAAPAARGGKAGAPTAAIPARSAPAARTGPADYECRFTEDAPRIDGRGDDPAWKLAQPVNDFTMPWLASGDRKAKTATRARLLWDRDYLYFFAEMDDSDVFAGVSEHDGQTWNDDVFELFLKPADDKPGYYEFQVNAAGTTMDMFLPRRGAGGYDRFKADGEFDFVAAVQVQGTLNRWTDADQGWSVEGRLGWKDFVRTGGRPNPDERWTFALCRYDYSVDFEGPALSTSAPLATSPRADFHHFEDYAPIRFVGLKQSPQSESVRAPGIDRLPPLATHWVTGSPDPPPPYTTERIFEKLPIEMPVQLAAQPGSDLLWIVTQPWAYAPTTVRRFRNLPDASELETLVPVASDELVYDLHFSPRFADNGYVYVGSNGSFGGPKRSRITRYHVDPRPPYRFDRDSATTIIEWESDGHNGTAIAFGPDGMLYVTSGDGTSDSDVNLRGQDLTQLTAKLLRLDVDHSEGARPYTVPADNPFVGQENVRSETWAYGLRNPWRLWIDQPTGDIWIGNNGQDLWEQVYLIQPGANYGWSVVEGTHDFYPQRERGPQPFSRPIAEHSHGEARSLTGGLVYRGDKFGDLMGAYLYGDYSTGKVWAIQHDGPRVTRHDEIADTPLQITALVPGSAGDIWLLDHGGKAIHRLVRKLPVTDPAQVFPTRLSESGLFAEVPTHQMTSGIIPYSVNAQLWSDGAEKARFLALGHESGELPRIGYTSSGGWNFPNGTVVVKSFALQLADENPRAGDAAAQSTSTPRRWVETRLLVRQQNEWTGYSYQWNDAGTDATLVGAEGSDRPLVVADPASLSGLRRQTWHYPSRTECMVCHSRAANYLLGLQTCQLNRDHDYGGGRIDNQLRALEHLGLLRVGWAAENAQSQRKALIEAARAGAGDRALAKETEARIKQSVDQALGRWSATRDQRAAPQESPLLPRAPEHLPRLADPLDASAPLASRARAYLHANCAQCHVEAGGGNSKIELGIDTPLAKMNLVDEKPSHQTFGIPDARLVAPGAPDRSILLSRVAARGPSQMPPLATSIVDQAAVDVLQAWIIELARPADEAK